MAEENSPYPPDPPPSEPPRPRFWDAAAVAVVLAALVAAGGAVINSQNSVERQAIIERSVSEREQCKLALEYFGDETPGPAAETMQDELAPLMLETVRRCARNLADE